MQGLRHRGQAPPRVLACPPLAASETEEKPSRAAAAAAPPAGPPSLPSSTLERLKSAFTQLGPLLGGSAREASGAAAGAAAARASADAPPADPVENRRRTWAGIARSLGVAVRDPADYMRWSMYDSADALLQAKDGTLLPAHFSMVQLHPRFRRSAAYAWAKAERFDPDDPPLLRLPFARFAPADVVLLLRWTYEWPSEAPFGRGDAKEKEFKALAALFVEDAVAAAWWRKAGEVDALGGAGGA